MLTNIYKRNFGILATDKILFFGSGKVAYPSAVKIYENYQNAKYVTHYTPIKEKLNNQLEIFCREQQLPLFTPIKSKGDKQKVAEQWNSFAQEIQKPDFGVVCSFGYMIPQKIISVFKKGMIVIHPSLLPKYRGGSPIFHAIANGDQTTGVSYIEISPRKFDSGNLLLQKQCVLSKSAKYEQVEASLANFCADNLLQVLNNIDELRPGVAQSELKIPEHELNLLKAPIIRLKNLDLNQPAEKVYNLHRAIGNPRVKFIDREIIINLQRKYLEDTENKPIGTLKVKAKKLYVKCLDKYIRVFDWKEISKRQAPCGYLIAAYLKGKEESQWPRFQ